MKITFLFIAVVIINSVAVYLQRRFKLYTQLFGRYDWAAHVILLSIIWTVFILGLILIKPPVWKSPAGLWPLGALVALLGISMIAVTVKRLGIEGTLNGWFFGRGPKEHLRGGVFRLQNPMYIGFVLSFVGTAFWLENAFYIVMAGLSFLLLNVLQARIERH